MHFRLNCTLKPADGHRAQRVGRGAPDVRVGGDGPAQAAAHRVALRRPHHPGQAQGDTHLPFI